MNLSSSSISWGRYFLVAGIDEDFCEIYVTEIVCNEGGFVEILVVGVDAGCNNGWNARARR